MKRIIISAFTAISFAIVATASASDCIANSPTELQSKFEQAFKAKNNTALLSLFNWSGIEPSLEGQLRKEYSNLSLNKNSIYSELKDPNIAIREANSMNFYLNVTPIKTLYFERSYGSKIDPLNKTAGNLGIGKVGSCYLFSNYTKTKLAN